MEIIKTPRSLDLEITNHCNLRCRYCYHFTSPGDVKEDLDKNEWLQFFEELNNCNVMNLCLQGGEPFFREDLLEIIEGIVKNRMRFSILSNGTLIDKDKSCFLAKTGRCNYVQISIDGSSSKVHDSFRGEGTFCKAINAIELLKSNGVGVAVRVTIHKENVQDLNGIARLLLKDLKLDSFSTNAASYMGLCVKNSNRVQLNSIERTEAMEKLVELNKKYNGRITADAGPLAEAKNWQEMEDCLKNNEESSFHGGYLTGCGCSKTKLGVRADGAIVPCTLLGHIELGRINQDSLKDIWQSHSELNKLRERSKIPLTDFSFCKGCEYIAHCTGNCPALAYTLLGEVDHPSPDACLKRFLGNGGKLVRT